MESHIESRRQIAMKKLISFVAGIAITLTTAAAAVPAQSGVDDAMNKLNAAMIAGDRDKMMTVTAGSLSYGHSSGRVQTQAAFVDQIASGQTKYKRIDITKTVTTVAGDAAVVRNHFNGTIEVAGKQSDVDFDVLMLWHKQNGTWKLLARQGYKY
jgi:hypothetical protein